MGAFDILLEDLSTHVGTGLRSINETCTLTYPGGPVTQLAVHKDKKRLLLVIVIGKLPPGTMRDEFLRRALKCNQLPNTLGIFGYGNVKDELVYYTTFPLRDVRADEIAKTMDDMQALGKKWMQAIENKTAPV